MKQRLVNYLLGNIVGVVTTRDVIRTDKGVLYLGSERVTPDEIKQLQAEIKALERFRIWRSINETVRYHAVHKAVHEATNFEHVLSGKMALWTLDLFDSIIKIIKDKSMV